MPTKLVSCHPGRKHYSRGLCQICYGAKWYAKNREAVKARSSKWYYENRERALIAQRKWVDKNSDQVKATRAKWRANNRERINANGRKWRADNPERSRAISARYRAANKESRADSARRYNADHRKERAEYHARRKSEDPQYKIKDVLRKRVAEAIKINSKAGSAVRDLGCSIAEFKAHIENQFLPGMTWENWGIHGWHLDHIVPLASYDLTSRMQFLEACNWKNYQPLWASDNLRKWARISIRGDMVG